MKEALKWSTLAITFIKNVYDDFLNFLNSKIFILPGVCAALGIKVCNDKLMSSVLNPCKYEAKVAANTLEIMNFAFPPMVNGT